MVLLTHDSLKSKEVTVEANSRTELMQKAQDVVRKTHKGTYGIDSIVENRTSSTVYEHGGWTQSASQLGL